MVGAIVETMHDYCNCRDSLHGLLYNRRNCLYVGAILVETVCNSRNGLHIPLCNRRNRLHTGHADLARATDLHRGGKRETAWTEEMVGKGSWMGEA